MNRSLEKLAKTWLLGHTFSCRTIKQNEQGYLMRGYDKSKWLEA
jgi:hypothetical protein